MYHGNPKTLITVIVPQKTRPMYRTMLVNIDNDPKCRISFEELVTDACRSLSGYGSVLYSAKMISSRSTIRPKPGVLDSNY